MAGKVIEVLQGAVTDACLSHPDVLLLGAIMRRRRMMNSARTFPTNSSLWLRCQHHDCVFA